MATVRICVCGDEGTGKSSLITALVKGVFVTSKIQPVLPQITLPPTLGTPDNVTTVIVDTSALPHERTNLRKEIRKSNVILLAYSDHYSYERVALFWMPYFRSQGVNVPVVLCANKSDLASNGNTSQVVEDEMLPVMAEFKEIDSCIRTSARENHNVNEVFFLCQKAVTHPIAPLFDSKEMALKPAATSALKRIFYLCDKNQDGVLDDDEIRAFQAKVFDKTLSQEDLTNIKRSIQEPKPQPTVSHQQEEEEPPPLGLDAFIRLNTMFIQKGRHETLWMILRQYHYNDSLSLQPSFLTPKLEIPPNCSAELSPTGYRFFVDLFLLFDKDNDGGLSSSELSALFNPTPGLPQLWLDSDFPSCTVRNDAGHVTLQGWLAQWSMTTFESPHTTLAYLAYLGFETKDKGGTTSAIKITPPRKRRRRKGNSSKQNNQGSGSNKIDRSVFLCYILGASDSGKTASLDAFLNRPFDGTYHPTIKPLVAVNSVELPGGKQCHLILRELGELEPAILENSSKLSAVCDIICYVYDSSNAESFAYIAELRRRYPHLEALPAVFAATKADRDKAVQNADVQPENYTSHVLGLAEPLHVSVRWNSIQELFVHLAECAAWPSLALPRVPDDDKDRTALFMGIGAAAVGIAAVAWIWKKNAAAAAMGS